MTSAIRHLVPLGSEKQWSDLLAALIELDPRCIAHLVGLSPSDTISVRREVVVGGERIDMILDVDGAPRCAVEVKVLSGLGPTQLNRYLDAFPGLERYVLVFCEQLPVHLERDSPWHTLTWESWLSALRKSDEPLVSRTAAAWSEQLANAMPPVGPTLRWNDLADGDDFVLALRARMSWVYSQLRPPSPIQHDLVPSAAGVSWVARMYTPAAAAGYKVMVEAQERLQVRDFPKIVSRTSRMPIGPSIRVSLMQSEVDTSAGFDWDYLLSLWPLMNAARDDWVTNSARVRAPHDRDGWQRMVAHGAPRYLGVGFGEAQAKQSNACLFGARFQLLPDVTLSRVVSAIHETAELVLAMARFQPESVT